MLLQFVHCIVENQLDIQSVIQVYQNLWELKLYSCLNQLFVFVASCLTLDKLINLRVLCQETLSMLLWCSCYSHLGKRSLVGVVG